MLDAQATLREPEARYTVCTMHHTRDVAKGGIPDLGIPPRGWIPEHLLPPENEGLRTFALASRMVPGFAGM